MLYADEKEEELQIHTNATPVQHSHLDELPKQYPELSTFVMLVNLAQLDDIFNGTGPFTVFAPTNDAFKKLGEKRLDELKKPKNRDELSTLLIYHVVPGKYVAKNLRSRTAPSINGKRIDIQVEGNEIKVNNAKVVKTDIIGPNGVLHEIDTVLIP